MTAEFGIFFLVLALLVSLFQSSYFIPKLRRHITPCLLIAAWLQALCIAAALVILITLRLDSDFSVVHVIQHSNLSLPTLYKITGAWGNHEGSMLLWVLVLALFGALLTNHSNIDRLHIASAIQSLLCAGFIIFILYTSNPFARQFPPVVDGQTLNPLLQDIGLAIHPPLLYIGYVGFGIVFSLAVAALIRGRVDRAWATHAHPWILTSWSALTIGIGLGSWWAYRELGWGGWWFWDPVENASLLPWLSGTALLHSNIVLKKRGALAPWVILLAILTFGLSLLGTFLVRSGMLTSVHSFASDPARGLFILVYIIVSFGGALLLYGLRGHLLRSEGSVTPSSREGMIVINNLFLLTACATVLLGTLYPLFAQWSGETITVGAPYFNATFLPLMAIPLFFAGLAPFMAWKKANMRASFPMRALLTALLFAAAAIYTKNMSAIAGFALAAWLGTASLQWLFTSSAQAKWSIFLGHIGAAVLVVGITASSIGKQEVERWVKPGDTLSIAGHEIHYDSAEIIKGANYSAKRATLTMDSNTLFPEYRTYNITNATTSEAAIHYSWRGDIYAVIGETSPEGTTALRVYYQPMMYLIWLGFVLMGIGGIVAIINNDRRFIHATL